MQDHNRRFKLIFEFGLGKGFAPTRPITSIFLWIWFHLKVLREVGKSLLNLETFAEVKKLSCSLKVLAKVEELNLTWHVVTAIAECY